MHEMCCGFVQEKTGDAIVMETGSGNHLHHIVELGIGVVKEQAVHPRVDQFVALGFGRKFDDEIHKNGLVHGSNTSRQTRIVFLHETVSNKRFTVFRTQPMNRIQQGVSEPRIRVCGMAYEHISEGR
jgi:hypothetical protein